MALTYSSSGKSSNVGSRFLPTTRCFLLLPGCVGSSLATIAALKHRRKEPTNCSMIYGLNPQAPMSTSDIKFEEGLLWEPLNDCPTGMILQLEGIKH